MENGDNDETIAMDITGQDLVRQERKVARPVPHRQLRTVFGGGYRREDVDKALAAADKRADDSEHEYTVLDSAYRNLNDAYKGLQGRFDDLGRQAAAVLGRAEAAEKERDALRERLDHPWKAAGESAENLVSHAKADAERIRADAEKAVKEAVEKARQQNDGLLEEARRQADETRGQAARILDTAKSDAQAVRDAAKSEAEKTLADARTEAEGLRRTLADEKAAHEKAMTEREREADQSTANAAAAVAKARSVLQGLLDQLD